MKLTAPQIRVLEHVSQWDGTIYAEIACEMNCNATFAIRAVDRTLDSLIRKGLVQTGEGDGYSLTGAGREALKAVKK